MYKRQLDNRTIGSGKAGPVTLKIQKAFFDVVSGRNKKYQHWLAPVGKLGAPVAASKPAKKGKH